MEDGESGATQGSEMESLDFELANGLELVDLPECGSTGIPCNGACVGREAEMNGCQVLVGSTIYRGALQDSAGAYWVASHSAHSEFFVTDEGSGDLTLLGTHPKGNLFSLQLALTAETIYYLLEGTPQTLWSMSRSGGEPVLVKEEMPLTRAFTVIGDSVYVALSSSPQLVRLALEGEETETFERDVERLAHNGNDLYFLQSVDDGDPELYRASNADIDQAELLAEAVRAPILGFDDDWVYAYRAGETISDRVLHRFAKNGSDSQPIVSLGSGDIAVLTPTAIVFTHSDYRTREFVNTVDHDGANRTVVGYLPTGTPRIGFMTADSTYVYVNKGFTLSRLRR